MATRVVGGGEWLQLMVKLQMPIFVPFTLVEVDDIVVELILTHHSLIS